jgi:HSP20 family protein
MERIRSIQLRWLQGELGHSPFSQLAHSDGWRPSINAYRCSCCISICVDLAGVDKADIDLQVEPTRIVLRGIRSAPEPSGDEPKAQQILAMEIDHGPFLRELRLPVEVNPSEATAEQRNGFLWIKLPLFKQP